MLQGNRDLRSGALERNKGGWGDVCVRANVREWKRSFGVYLSPEDFLQKERRIHFFHSQHVDKAILSKITDFFDSIALSRIFSFSAVKPPGEDTTAEENELAD